MTTSSRTDVAWKVLESAQRALLEAEQQQRFKHHHANPPAKNRRLAEAVERAQKRVDAAWEDVTKLSGYEA